MRCESHEADQQTDRRYHTGNWKRRVRLVLEGPGSKELHSWSASAQPRLRNPMGGDQQCLVYPKRLKVICDAPQGRDWGWWENTDGLPST